MDYQILQSGHHWEKQIFHVNLLKEWKGQEGYLLDSGPDSLELGRLIGECPGEQKSRVPLLGGTFDPKAN